MPKIDGYRSNNIQRGNVADAESDDKRLAVELSRHQGRQPQDFLWMFSKLALYEELIKEHAELQQKYAELERENNSYKSSLGNMPILNQSKNDLLMRSSSKMSIMNLLR